MWRREIARVKLTRTIEAGVESFEPRVRRNLQIPRRIGRQFVIPAIRVYDKERRNEEATRCGVKYAGAKGTTKTAPCRHTFPVCITSPRTGFATFCTALKTYNESFYFEKARRSSQISESTLFCELVADFMARSACYFYRYFFVYTFPGRSLVCPK